MTTLDDAVEIDRSTPGWLRRAWEAGLAKREWRGPANCGEESGYLLRGDTAEILEPYISPTPAPGLHEGDSHILHFTGLDSAAADALLSALPPSSLELDYSMYAPPAATMLRVVAENPGVVHADGSVYSPQLTAEAVRPRTLRILDPTLTDVEPDVVPGDLPTWIEELPAEEYADYLKDRQTCIDHGTTRPAWLTAAVHYRIDGARGYPDARVLTDPAGLQFTW